MITVTVDAGDALARLTALEERQLPFALALALNRTAEEVQTEIRGHVQEAFTIRRPWVLTNVKIARENFATKTKPRVVIEIPPDSVLGKFEGGGTKSPRSGGLSIAIPNAVRRTKAGIVSKRDRPRAFAFTQAYTSTATRVTIYRGNRRTFMLQRPDGSGVILQRVGRGGPRAKGAAAAPSHPARRDPALRTLWMLRPNVRIPAILQFVQRGAPLARERFPINLRGMLAYALRTAR